MSDVDEQMMKQQAQQNFGRQAKAYNANCLLADKNNLKTIVDQSFPNIFNHMYYFNLAVAKPVLLVLAYKLNCISP